MAAAEYIRPGSAEEFIARATVLPVRNQLLVVGKRWTTAYNDEDAAFVRGATSKAGLAPHDVEWTFNVHAVKELFYGVRPETGPLPQSVPRGVVMYSRVMDHMRSMGPIPRHTPEAVAIVEACEAHGVPLVDGREERLYSPESLAERLGDLMAGAFIALPVEQPGPMSDVPPMPAGNGSPRVSVINVLL